MKKNITLAFDIGGTKITSGLVDASKTDYKIIGSKKSLTPDSEKEIMQMFVDKIEVYSKKYDFKKVGISIAGQVDPTGKVLIHAPNLKIEDNFPLADFLKKETGYNVFIQNDVQSFAIGEDSFGKSKDYKNAIFIAIGTGVGGAIKINGKIYKGSHNIAGEFGHMSLAFDGEGCSCGRRGCFERYVSGVAIGKRYKEKFGKIKNTKEILEDAARGKEEYLEIMSEVSHFLAMGISNLVNILDPEIVVLGGSVVKRKEILDLAEPIIRKQVLPSARKVKIVRSSLKDKAHLLGVSL